MSLSSSSLVCFKLVDNHPRMSASISTATTIASKRLAELDEVINAQAVRDEHGILDKDSISDVMYRYINLRLTGASAVATAASFGPDLQKLSHELIDVVTDLANRDAHGVVDPADIVDAICSRQTIDTVCDLRHELFDVIAALDSDAHGSLDVNTIVDAVCSHIDRLFWERYMISPIELKK